MAGAASKRQFDHLRDVVEARQKRLAQANCWLMAFAYIAFAHNVGARDACMATAGLVTSFLTGFFSDPPRFYVGSPVEKQSGCWFLLAYLAKRGIVTPYDEKAEQRYGVLGLRGLQACRENLRVIDLHGEDEWYACTRDDGGRSAQASRYRSQEEQRLE